ncbi:3-deoxy-7-phosphoheptulonate synthase, partial [Acinetobacter baumannii]
QFHRNTIQNILKGKDPRHLLIVGPCSIHSESEALEYGEKLSKLSSEVKDTFLIVMRAYIEKPRTKLGWKGLLFDPHLNNQSNALSYGIDICRKTLL